MEFLIFANTVQVLLYGHRSHLAASAAYIYLANVVCSEVCGSECLFLADSVSACCLL